MATIERSEPSSTKPKERTASHCRRGREQEDDIAEAGIGCAATEKDEGGVGAQPGDEDRGDDDASIVTLRERVELVESAELVKICGRDERGEAMPS
jgi:hypothetical protein